MTHHHDLQAIFDRLNRDYFDGKVVATIEWGRRTTVRPTTKGKSEIRLATYYIEEKRITIHPVHDSPFVPSFYIAFNIYHEMIHASRGDGSHDKRFRIAEATYAAYAQAMKFEWDHMTRIVKAWSCSERSRIARGGRL